MKAKIILILMISTIAFSSILLYQLMIKVDDKNGFERLIRNKTLNIAKVKKLSSRNCYFAKVTHSKVYLKNLGDSSAINVYDFSFNKLKNHDLRLAELPQFANKKINIGITDSIVYITNRIGDLIVQGIEQPSFRKRCYSMKGLRYDQSLLLGGKSLVVRQAVLRNNQLGRNLLKYGYENRNLEIAYQLEKQIDGFFCTDGLLKYNSYNKRIYYLFIYRGTYLCLDTNLNLLYQAKTIDTVSTAKMQTIKREKTVNKQTFTYTTQSKPPKQINRNFAFYQNRIYVLSMLKADNETLWSYNSNQPVDVYDSATGGYVYSFYIPKYNGVRPREIALEGSYLFAIYDDIMIKFILDS